MWSCCKINVVPKRYVVMCLSVSLLNVDILLFLPSWCFTMKAYKQVKILSLLLNLFDKGKGQVIQVVMFHVCSLPGVLDYWYVSVGNLT